MTLRPYKFVVQAVVQQLDGDGNVTGEQQAEPVVLFGCDVLAEWARDFPEKLAAAGDQLEARDETDSAATEA